MEGAVERKRPAPCCEDCEMLHLTSRGRELLRVKATVALRCSTCVKERWEWRPAALGRRVMLGMLFFWFYFFGFSGSTRVQRT